MVADEQPATESAIPPAATALYTFLVGGVVIRITFRSVLLALQMLPRTPEGTSAFGPGSGKIAPRNQTDPPLGRTPAAHWQHPAFDLGCGREHAPARPPQAPGDAAKLSSASADLG